MKKLEKLAVQIKGIASRRAKSPNQIPDGVFYYPDWCLIDTRNKMTKKEAFKLYLKSIFSFPGVYLGYLIDSLKPHLRKFAKCLAYSYFFTLSLIFVLSIGKNTANISTYELADILLWSSLFFSVTVFCMLEVMSDFLRLNEGVKDPDDRNFEILTIVRNTGNDCNRIASSVLFSNDRVSKDFFARIASETNVDALNLKVAYSRLSFLERTLLVEGGYNGVLGDNKALNDNDLDAAREYLFRNLLL